MVTARFPRDLFLRLYEAELEDACAEEAVEERRGFLLGVGEMSNARSRSCLLLGTGRLARVGEGPSSHGR
jgi:hypothetical protein